MNRCHFEFRLPDWIKKTLRAKPACYPDIESRMHLAVDLARENVIEKTGGPFGAAVFEQVTGRLISVGVNLVVYGQSSVLHAEMVAIILAEQSVGSYKLNAPELPYYDLATSVEPCAMCLGAIPWSGIRRVICGARQEDAEAIGFDEGAKPEHWIRKLHERKIEVVQDILRDKAIAVLHEYKDQGGIIYNGAL